MARSRALALLLLLLPLQVTRAVAAQPIVLSGAISDRDGQPIPGARAQAFAVESEYLAARRWLDGKAEAPPLFEVATDADGRFRIAVADPGFLRVRARAPGYVAQELPCVEPYVDDAELHPARLERAAEVTLRVEDANGRPVVGAWVGVAPALRSRFGDNPWLNAPRRARTAEDGTARLPRGTGETPLWLAIAPNRSEVAAPGRGDVTLRLVAEPARRLRVRDPSGQPVAQAVVRAGRGLWPLALSGRDGTVSVSAGLVSVEVLAPSGLRRDRSLPAPAEGSAIEVVLPAVGALEGRVLERAGGAAVAGALVWDSRRPEAATRSRPDGGYLVAGLEPGTSLLRAVARGYLAAATPANLRRPEAVERGPAIALHAARLLRGVVVDHDGRAVRGAETIAQPDFDRAPRELTMGGLAVPERRATSDGAGRFALPTLVRGFPYRLRTRFAGFAPAKTDVAGMPGNEGELRIVLSRGVGAFGTAVDRDRRPVAGARAELREAPAQQPRFNPAEEEAQAEIAIADTTGRFSFLHLAPGRYTLAVRASGHAPAEVPGMEIVSDTQRQDLGTIVLVGEATVEGVVVDGAGRPIGGAAIAVGEADPTRRVEALVERSETPATESSADGWFRVGGLRPREAVDLVVTAAGFAEQRVAGVVPMTAQDGAGAQRLRVTLHPASRITGRVVDQERHPLVGIAVGYSIERRSADLALHVGGSEAVVTDEDGRFELLELPEGIVHVMAIAEGYRLGELEVPIAPGKDALGLELVLLPGAAVSGRVLDAGGKPVSDAMVGADGGSSGPFAISDAEGVYRLEGVALGKRRLNAYDRRSSRQTSKEVEVGSGDVVVDLVFAGGASVSGIVLDAGGEPVAEAAVRLGAAGRLATASTGIDGRFTVPDVRDGEHSLSVRKPGFASADLKVEVKDGAPVEGLEVRLERGATLVGELRGLRFSELPRARITAHRMSGFSDWFEASADFEGRFRLQGLAAGDWLVMAVVESVGRRAQSQVTIAPGEGEASVVLEFTAGLTLTGVVRRRGEPWGGADVVIQGKDVQSGGQVATTADGAFRFEGLEAGSYDLSIRGLRDVAHQRTVQLDGDREIAIDLVAASLAGRVLDASTGEPLAAAEVRLVTPGEDSRSPYGFGSTHTDSRGAFHFEDLAAGDWRLRAQVSGYALGERDVRIGEDGTSEPVEMALQPTEGLTVELTVDGSPLPGGQALFLDASGRVAWGGSFGADERGRARLDSVPAGHYTAWLMGPDAAPAVVEVAVPGPLLRVALPRGTRLTVRVPELAGDPRIARVTLVDAGGQPLRLPGWQSLRSEFDLRYGLGQVRGLTAGAWNLTVRAADDRIWQTTVVIAPGGGESEVSLEEKR